MMNTLANNDSKSLERFLAASEKPVLVDFYADWCGPCNIQMPILERFSSEYKDQVAFLKVNVDEHKALLADYGIRSIPTLLLFNGKDVVASHVGVSDKKALVELIGKAA